MTPPNPAPAPAPSMRLRTTDHAVAYDGSYDGFLCVLHEAFRHRARPARIEVAGERGEEGGLFGIARPVETDAATARATARALERHLGPEGAERLRLAFLSESPDVEATLFLLVEAVAARGGGVLADLRFPPALAAERWAARVRREVHRMHAFVRFERRAGAEGADAYVARVRPDHHVLPLLAPHFEARYPALRWAIVDAGRGLALAYDPAAEPRAARLVPAALADAAPEASEEAAFQALWRSYIRAVTVEERRNARLHLRQVPRRYWPYLTEQWGAPAESPTGVAAS